MPPQLTYFNGRGRAEAIRMLYAAKGIAFEDRRIEFKDWPQEKPNAPQGTLPYMMIDGKKVGQSIALARYVARECGYYGKTNLEGLFIDEIVDCAVDLLNKGAEAKFTKDDAKVKTFEEETAPKILQQLENAISSRSLGGNFAVGKALSWADIEIYVTTEVAGVQVIVAKSDKYPKLKANIAKTEENQKIKDWIKKRPKTEF